MRRERSRQPLFVGATGGEHDEDYEILVGKINQTTSTAADVDSGKKFVDVNQDVVIGTSTYKADYIALNQSVNTINNNLESVITGNGSGGGLTVDQVKGLIDGTGTSFTIPEGTTSIRVYAFRDDSGLVTVDIPNSITNIGNYAFYSCTNLTTVNIPDSVTSIGDGAFINCSGITNISLPSGITILNTEMFYNCSGITNISLPSGLTTIGLRVFSGCSKLSSISLPSGVTSIANGAFNGCTSLTTLTFDGTPTTINSSAFNNCPNLTTIYVPWSQGEVAGSPWGAVNATIVYDHTA